MGVKQHPLVRPPPPCARNVWSPALVGRSDGLLRIDQQRPGAPVAIDVGHPATEPLKTCLLPQTAGETTIR